MTASTYPIGLALGSGAARGLAHIGVLKVLEEEGVAPGCIAGTSIGAFIGALYAAGVSCGQMEKIAKELDWKQLARLLDPVLPASGGIIDGQRVSRFMAELLPVTTFEQLRIPLAVTATDIDSGEAVVIRKGNLIEALRAAIAFPGIFTPVNFGGRLLIDGGLCNPVPVDEARKLGARRIIGVCAIPRVSRQRLETSLPADREPRPQESGLSRLLDATGVEKLWRELWRKNGGYEKDQDKPDDHRSERRPPGLLQVFAQSVAIMENQINDLRLQRNHYDLLLRPELHDINLVEFHRAAEIIAAGEAEARRHRAELRDLFQEEAKR